MPEDPSAGSGEKVRGLDPLALLAHAVRRTDPRADGGAKRVGDYELIAQIAEGGMGVVWWARQISLQRTVAVKMIRSGLLATTTEVQRFRREAEAAASLDHPNIVPIYEIGEDGERHYFSMKLIEGGSLAELTAECDAVHRRSAEWARRVAGLVAAMARAVHHAHQRGVLHRDIKPTNVLLDERGEPHLTDFGLAKLMEHSQDMTLTLAVMGTPAYMAPEQAAGKSQDLTMAADIYGLGAVLYELLTGRPPFEGNTTLEVLRQVQEREPVSLRKANPGLSRGLETICLKCLQKEPRHRYATAEELAADLERWLAGKPIAARPVGPLVRFYLWSRRNPVAAMAGVLLLALAAVSTLAALRLREQRNEINENLRVSLLAQARMHRLSTATGRRPESLRILTEAARIRPGMEVRNEVIAALALPDLGPPETWYETKKPLPRIHQRMLTADGELLGIFGQEEGITVYHRSDGSVKAELVTPPNRAATGLFSPDGRYLTCFDLSQHVFVWDLHREGDGPRKHSLTFSGPWEVHPNFTPDSRSIILMGQDNWLRFFDLENGAGQRAIRLPFIAQRIAVSPAGDQLAMSSAGTLYVWTITPAVQIQSHQHRSGVNWLVWHPQGRFVAAGYESGDWQLFDSVTGASRWQTPHRKNVEMTFEPHGEMMATASFDSTHRYADPATGTVLFETKERGGVQATSDGRSIALFNDDGSITARDILRSTVFRTFSSPRTGYPNFSGLDISPDGRWLISGENAGLHVWDLARGNEVAFVPAVMTLRPRFHPGGRFIISGGPAGQMRWPFDAAPDGSGARAGPPEVFAPADGSGASFTRDGQWLAVPWRLGSLILNWKDPSQRVVFGEKLPPPRHNYVVLSPDKRWAVGASYSGAGVTVWNGHDGSLLKQLIPLDNANLAVSPDGRTLATGTASETVLWDTTTWEPRRRIASGLATGAGVPVPVAFSSDGSLFAVALAHQEIHLFDAHTGEALAMLTPPVPANLDNLAFSADGRHLAAQTEGPALHVWDLEALRRALSAQGLNW